MMKHTILILSLVLYATFSFAQLKVTMALDSTAILMGDQVYANYTIRKPKDAVLINPNYGRISKDVPEVEIVSIEDAELVLDGNIQTYKQRLKLTSFDSGMYIIPQIQFEVVRGTDTLRTLSNTAYLAVSPVIIDNDVELAPIKDILVEKKNWTDFLPWIYGIGGLLLSILIIFLLLRFLLGRKTNKGVVQEEPKEIIPAHILALRKLKILKERELWQKDKVKEYYSEISYTMREYLENRYGINALESVTHEIMPELRDKEIPEENTKDLLHVLSTADMVKFAKVRPQMETHEQVIQEAFTFVEKTQEIPEPITEEDNTENT